MAEFQVKNLLMALSADEEATFNTAYVGNYNKFVTSNAAFYVPTAEKFDNKGKVGSGQDLPTARSTGYLNSITMEISDTLDTFIHPILIRRCLGIPEITPVTPAVTGLGNVGTYSHQYKMAKSIDNPKTSSVVWSLPDPSGAASGPNSGVDFVWTGVTVNSFSVSGTRSDPPAFTASLLGTGGRVNRSASHVLNNLVNPKYVIGAETEIYFTHPTTSSATPGTGGQVDLAVRSSATQRLLGWNIGVANNNKTDDKRPGDPRLYTGNPSGGHFVNRIASGTRDVTGEVSIAMNERSLAAEISDSLADTLMTNFVISHKGAFIMNTATPPALSAVQYKVEFILPKTYLTVEEGVNDNGLAVLRTSLFPVFSETDNTTLIVNVYSERATIV